MRQPTAPSQPTEVQTERARAARELRREWLWVLLAVAAATAFGLLRGGSSSGLPKVGQPLPDFALQDLEGRPVRLSDYRGQVVLINAWATWCPPCRAEMPLLEDTYQAQRENGLALLAINAGESRETAAGYAAENGLTFPILLDPGSRVLQQLGVSSYPTSIVVGPDGKVKQVQIGAFTPITLESAVMGYLYLRQP